MLHSVISILQPNILIAAAVALIFCSCNGENTSSNENVNDINSSEDLTIWTYDPVKDTILLNEEFPIESLHLDQILEIQNSNYDNKVFLEYSKKSNDAIFVKIQDSKFLTQRMGSTGAYEYMVSATFNLTELPDINFVNFDFEIGDHASPGTYNRNHFWNEILPENDSLFYRYIEYLDVVFLDKNPKNTLPYTPILVGTDSSYGWRNTDIARVIGFLDKATNRHTQFEISYGTFGAYINNYTDSLYNLERMEWLNLYEKRSITK
ncbi:hypothetical protein K6119_08015 [Paracrocinitomix mangrovi]|uniref:hypothetical protein n=1 Tax=Paracrocinitomix mangrovi TaxID=2862509 RepID=UPI001C8E4F93|nr:hypothetical protein [Paracrocinitomix mangrovi]UKN03457.1 hypothetical protein K6119_08015 [Paracrocinitomix mangrovi]